jgi:SlyX protein
MKQNGQNLTNAELESRLADAEARIAFQEDSLQTLSDQLAHQQQLTDQLQRSVQMLYIELRDRRDESGHALNGQAAEEKPPHY